MNNSVIRIPDRGYVCEGWMKGSGHIAVSHEYRIRVASASHYPFDTIECWLCDDCAALMCTEYWLRGKTVRDVRIWRDNFYVHTEPRAFGVWEKAIA